MTDLPTLPEKELAEAMCVTSHHGVNRTEWPCGYHVFRAEKIVKELASMRRRALAARTDHEEG